jgi:hypothetical protein
MKYMNGATVKSPLRPRAIDWAVVFEERVKARRSAEEERERWAAKGRATLLWGLVIMVTGLVGAVFAIIASQ